MDVEKKLLKFNKNYNVMTNGVVTKMEAGKSYMIEGKASISRWIKRGCTEVEPVIEDEPVKTNKKSKNKKNDKVASKS